MHFHIITLFPESIEPYLAVSIIGRAQKSGKINITFYNPRDFTKDKHKRVDGRPYGGGPGMVLQAEPILKAVLKARGRKKNVKVIFFSTSGREFTNVYAQKVANKFKDVILICGHYEGIDARVQKILRAEEVSIGPFVLTGGELPALVVIDAMARQIAGVLGNFDSVEESRTTSSEVYSRPEVLVHKGKKYRVPKVLLSGHHKDIEEWKRNRKGKGG